MTFGEIIQKRMICLKTALSVRQNTTNEIIYIAQLMFWLYVNDYVAKFPDVALSKVVKVGIESRLYHMKYHQKLVRAFDDAASCEKSGSVALWRRKLIEASSAIDSQLGTYYPYKYVAQPNVHIVTENERILITRFRTGIQTICHVVTGFPLTRFIISKNPKCQNLQEIFDDQYYSL